MPDANPQVLVKHSSALSVLLPLPPSNNVRACKRNSSTSAQRPTASPLPQTSRQPALWESVAEMANATCPDISPGLDKLPVSLCVCMSLSSYCLGISFTLPSVSAQRLSAYHQVIDEDILHMWGNGCMILSSRSKWPYKRVAQQFNHNLNYSGNEKTWRVKFYWSPQGEQKQCRQGVRLPGFWVEEGLSRVLILAIALRKTQNLACPWYKLSNLVNVPSL